MLILKCFIIKRKSFSSLIFKKKLQNFISFHVVKQGWILRKVIWHLGYIKWNILQNFLGRKGNQLFGNYTKMSKSPKTQGE